MAGERVLPSVRCGYNEQLSPRVPNALGQEYMRSGISARMHPGLYSMASHDIHTIQLSIRPIPPWQTLQSIIPQEVVDTLAQGKLPGQFTNQV